jgi:hypothetical protein
MPPFLGGCSCPTTALRPLHVLPAPQDGRDGKDAINGTTLPRRHVRVSRRTGTRFCSLTAISFAAGDASSVT